MADEQLFLKSEVIVEPLPDRSFAWPRTIAPVKSAMNPAFLQVPLLPYLQSPIEEFPSWCGERGIPAEHLHGRREWR